MGPIPSNLEQPNPNRTEDPPAPYWPTHSTGICVMLFPRELQTIYHHPESKKENLQSEALAPSSPTVDTEML